MDKCRYCENYMDGLEQCKFCHFEYCEDKYFQSIKSDDWDIFNLDENEWEHLQILDRLYSKDIQCYQADIWWDNNMAYLLGCRASTDKIAKALNLHEECVYNDGEQDFVLLNLFQEKYLRGILENE